MTAPNRQARDWDDTTEAEAEDGCVHDLPPVAVIDRLTRWYAARADLDGRLALSLDAEGLPIAADANRRRVVAYRQTVACLKALRERCHPPETAFRGHLDARRRPKARVRAPP